MPTEGNANRGKCQQREMPTGDTPTGVNTNGDMQTEGNANGGYANGCKCQQREMPTEGNANGGKCQQRDTPTGVNANRGKCVYLPNYLPFCFCTTCTSK